MSDAARLIGIGLALVLSAGLLAAPTAVRSETGVVSGVLESAAGIEVPPVGSPDLVGLIDGAERCIDVMTLQSLTPLADLEAAGSDPTYFVVPNESFLLADGAARIVAIRSADPSSVNGHFIMCNAESVGPQGIGLRLAVREWMEAEVARLTASDWRELVRNDAEKVFGHTIYRCLSPVGMVALTAAQTDPRTDIRLMVSDRLPGGPNACAEGEQ